MKAFRLGKIDETVEPPRLRNFADTSQSSAARTFAVSTEGGCERKFAPTSGTNAELKSQPSNARKTAVVDGLEIQPVDGRSFAPVAKSATVTDLSPHPDLFGGSVRFSDSDTHPDFLARAEIWRLQREGVISLAEASRRSAAIGQAGKSSIVQHSTPPRPRHSRPAPNPSRQYAPAMSTEAARDDRLTPNAKALLQVLRARCGKGRRTAITKGTMGAVMARSARSIRRYLVDLVRFGYVELEIAKTARGMHAGLVVQLTAKALPFFEEAKGLAAWLAEAPAAALKPFQPFRAVLSPASAGVTVLSPINQSPKDSFRQRLFSEGKQVIGLPPRPS